MDQFALFLIIIIFLLPQGGGFNDESTKKLLYIYICYVCAYKLISILIQI